MTFDPALGDLSVVIDPAAAATVLTAAFDGSTVRSPRRRDTKYRPLERCEATYDLELVATGGTHRRSIGVVTVTAAGVAARRFDDDPGLPSLAEALDPERMAAGHGAMCTDQFLIDGEGGGLGRTGRCGLPDRLRDRPVGARRPGRRLPGRLPAQDRRPPLPEPHRARVAAGPGAARCGKHHGDRWTQPLTAPMVKPWTKRSRKKL
jgi:hypothetical protein